MAVSVSVSEHRADIVLDRPQVLNALDERGFDDLATAVREVSDNPDARVVVVRGEGRSFCSGIDTGTFASGATDEPERLIERAQAGYRALAALEVPTIAAVHGHALGAGLQIALACDLRVVTDDSQLGLLEVRYGLVPDLGGTHRLPALVGPGVAKRMMWLGERIDGREAGRRRLAETVVRPEELGSTVDELAERLAAAPPRVLRAIKNLVDRAPSQTFEQGMDDVAEVQANVMRSSDFAEAIGAFLQKRAPSFTGN